MKPKSRMRREKGIRVRRNPIEATGFWLHIPSTSGILNLARINVCTYARRIVTSVYAYTHTYKEILLIARLRNREYSKLLSGSDSRLLSEKGGKNRYASRERGGCTKSLLERENGKRTGRDEIIHDCTMCRTRKRYIHTHTHTHIYIYIYIYIYPLCDWNLFV